MGNTGAVQANSGVDLSGQHEGVLQYAPTNEEIAALPSVARNDGPFGEDYSDYQSLVAGGSAVQAASPRSFLAQGDFLLTLPIGSVLSPEAVEAYEAAEAQGLCLDPEEWAAYLPQDPIYAVNMASEHEVQQGVYLLRPDAENPEFMEALRAQALAAIQGGADFDDLLYFPVPEGMRGEAEIVPSLTDPTRTPLPAFTAYEVEPLGFRLEGLQISVRDLRNTLATRLAGVNWEAVAMGAAAAGAAYLRYRQKVEMAKWGASLPAETERNPVAEPTREEVLSRQENYARNRIEGRERSSFEALARALARGQETLRNLRDSWSAITSRPFINVNQFALAGSPSAYGAPLELSGQPHVPASISFSTATNGRDAAGPVGGASGSSGGVPGVEHAMVPSEPSWALDWTNRILAGPWSSKVIGGGLFHVPGVSHLILGGIVMSKDPAELRENLGFIVQPGDIPNRPLSLGDRLSIVWRACWHYPRSMGQFFVRYPTVGAFEVDGAPLSATNVATGRVLEVVGTKDGVYAKNRPQSTWQFLTGNTDNSRDNIPGWVLERANAMMNGGNAVGIYLNPTNVHWSLSPFGRPYGMNAGSWTGETAKLVGVTVIHGDTMAVNSSGYRVNPDVVVNNTRWVFWMDVTVPGVETPVRVAVVKITAFNVAGIAPSDALAAALKAQGIVLPNSNPWFRRGPVVQHIEIPNPVELRRGEPISNYELGSTDYVVVGPEVEFNREALPAKGLIQAGVPIGVIRVNK